MIRYQEHDTFPLCCLDTGIIDIFLRTNNTLSLPPSFSWVWVRKLIKFNPLVHLSPVSCQLSGDVFVWRYCVLCLHYALVAQFVSPVPALLQQHDVSSKNYSQIYYFENSRDKSKVSDWMRWEDVSINSIWVSLWKGRSWIARQRFASGLTEHWEFYYLSSDIFF